MNPFAKSTENSQKTPEGERRLTELASQIFLSGLQAVSYDGAWRVHQYVEALYPDAFPRQPAPQLGGVALEQERSTKTIENGYPDKAAWPNTPPTYEDIARDLVRQATQERTNA